MRLIPLMLSFALLAGCTTETTHGYMGEFSVTLFATNTTSGWSLDEAHDVFWEGDESASNGVVCRVEERGGERTYVFEAWDEAWQQGFEMAMTLDPFDGTGVYELTADSAEPPIDITLSTTDQTYDLEARASGTCTVTISKGERFGDFTCPALEEYVLHESQDLPFTITGHWECAEIVTDG
jgi:hypothetical protein